MLNYKDGEKRYILSPDGITVGDTIVAGDNVDIQPGNCLPLVNIPLGTIIHNIEMKIGKGAQMVRSAGTAAQLMAKEGGYVLVRLPSGEVRKFNNSVVPVLARSAIENMKVKNLVRLAGTDGRVNVLMFVVWQ